MEELLNARGWTMYYQCGGCKGGIKRHYSNPDFPEYVVRTRPNKVPATFVILQNNVIIAGPGFEYQLAAKLDEHVL